MSAFVLKEPVTIRGHNLLGQCTDMSFVPVTTAGRTIFLDTGGINPHEMPVRPEMLSAVLNSLQLARPNQWLKYRASIIEHVIAACEGMHLYDGVGIRCSRRGLVYTGHAQHVHDALLPYLVPTGEPVAHTSIFERIPIETRRAGGTLEFIANQTDRLVIEVAVQYPGTRELTYTWDSSKHGFDAISGARGELKPHWRGFVRLFTKKALWPHGEAFADRKLMNTDAWLDSLARHRALDLLGALSCVTPYGRLVGTVRSRLAGHFDDVKLVRTLMHGLREVHPSRQAA